MTARIMEHDEAIKNLTAERYLLGELNVSDRDAYEEHLFSCPACFEQVKAGSEFVGHLRRTGAEEPHAKVSPARPGFLAMVRQPVAALALVLLLCVSSISLHQYRVIGGLKQVQVTPSLFLSDGAKSGDVRKLTVPPNSRFGLDFLLLQRGDFSSYEGQILSESGQWRLTPFTFSSDQAKGTVHLVLDSGTLGEGSFFVVINGLSADGHKAEITRYGFQLQLQE
jgi:hypothetical protein